MKKASTGSGLRQKAQGEKGLGLFEEAQGQMGRGWELLRESALSPRWPWSEVHFLLKEQ